MKIKPEHLEYLLMLNLEWCRKVLGMSPLFDRLSQAPRPRARETYPDAQGEAFRCPDCAMVSHNPNDVKHRYCGNCHRFFES